MAECYIECMANRKSRQRIEQMAKDGVPNARAVLTILERRDAGAPQYGERFKAWLAAAGKSQAEISAIITRLS